MPNPYSVPDSEDERRDRITAAWEPVDMGSDYLNSRFPTVVNLSLFDAALVRAINEADGEDGDHLP